MYFKYRTLAMSSTTENINGYHETILTFSIALAMHSHKYGGLNKGYQTYFGNTDIKKT